MHLISQSSVIPEIIRSCVLCIGKFDGVHLGHQALADHAVGLARKTGTRALAVTFDPPPAQVLNPDLPGRPPITPIGRRVQLLKDFGFADAVVFETGHWLLDLTAREFFDQIICERFAAVGLVEGPNFQFGRNRGGGVAELAQWCHQTGMTFEQALPVEHSGGWVTSSRIAGEIAAGEIVAARRLLGHAFETIGTVARGAGRGRGINVPTANLEQCDTLLPKPGVYAALASVESESGEFPALFPAAVNVGSQPTFASDVQRVEAHLIGHPDRDLYGNRVKLVWLERIRETIKFTGVEELVRQIQLDIETCRKIGSEFQ
ncbi:MAG: bifunctional riboflavin kinase/FMN adenylyltransferase [bacterium]